MSVPLTHAGRRAQEKTYARCQACVKGALASKSHQATRFPAPNCVRPAAVPPPSRPACLVSVKAERLHVSAVRRRHGQHALRMVTGCHVKDEAKAAGRSSCLPSAPHMPLIRTRSSPAPPHPHPPYVVEALDGDGVGGGVVQARDERCEHVVRVRHGAALHACSQEGKKESKQETKDALAWHVVKEEQESATPLATRA
jgi:hypothetical protein